MRKRPSLLRHADLGRDQIPDDLVELIHRLDLADPAGVARENLQLDAAPAGSEIAEHPRETGNAMRLSA